MRLLIKILGGLLGLALALGGILAFLVVRDSQPLVPEVRDLTPDERAWARAWIRDARPRANAFGKPITLSLTGPEANLLLAYLMDRLGQGQARLELGDGRARLLASVALPWQMDGRYVNLDLELSGSGRPPRVERLTLAGLPLPRPLGQTLATQVLEALDEEHLLQSVRMEPGQIQVTYLWRPEALEGLGRRLLPGQEWDLVLEYQDLLQEDARGGRKGEDAQLADLLSRLLRKAQARSQDGDPVAENRAAILALAAYVNGHQLPRAAGGAEPPSSGSTGPPPPRRVLLAGRRDLAQHFMTSAAIAARGGAALSDLSGLLKEAADARGGSGLSFADLAANRAGTRLALLAVGDSEGAAAIQTLARRGLSEADFMPPIDGLPEGLDQAQLVAGLSDPANPGYRRLSSQIERRIDALPLHRGPVR